MKAMLHAMLAILCWTSLVGSAIGLHIAAPAHARIVTPRCATLMYVSEPEKSDVHEKH